VRNTLWAGDKRGAAGGTTLLGVVIGEYDAFIGNAVDIRRPVTHHSFGVSADIGLANVVAPNNDDVGIGIRRMHGNSCRASAQREKANAAGCFSRFLIIMDFLLS